MEYVSRCPACSSLVRPEQDWCTLCHADLRPPQPEVEELRAPAESPAVEQDWTESDGEHLLEPSALMVADRPVATDQPVALGKHARHAAPEEPASLGESPLVGSPLPEAEISQLLAQLAAESPDPLGGMLSRLPESQGMRVLVSLAVGGTVAAVLVGICWIFGLIFG